MRLIIIEKPNYISLLTKGNLITEDTEIVCTSSIGLWIHSLRKLKFSDIPFTEDPDLLIPNPHNNHIPHFNFTTGSILNDFMGLDSLLSHLRSNINKYEEIICMPDIDRRGCESVQQLLNQIGSSSNSNTYFIESISTDLPSISRAWKTRETNLWERNELVQRLIREQQLKKTFDYWWNSNSKLVFSELCKMSGLECQSILSKYELMLIVALGKYQKPIGIDNLLSIMTNWKGSGKYQTKSNQIGSLISRMKIIENACGRGAISKDNLTGLYSLSESGLCFLAKLHSRTFDPDLPARLENWISQLDYSAMKKYIRTLFGRQLRYQRKTN